MGLFSRAKAFFSGSANDQYQYALPGGIEFITVTDGAGNVTAELHSSNEHRDAYYSNAFRACELAKCRPLASLPVHVYRRRDGVRETPSYRFCKRYETILRTKWNPFMSASEGTRWAMMTKDIKGNAFMRLEVDGAGLPVAIWPLAHKPRANNSAAVAQLLLKGLVVLLIELRLGLKPTGERALAADGAGVELLKVD